jgi:hypothetical protein
LAGGIGSSLAYFRYMKIHTITTAIASAALVTICACNKDTRDTAPNAPPVSDTPITRSAPPADRQDVNAPIEVVGCLQKESGFGTTYIVTSVNEPSQRGIGTTGNGTAVEREQLRAAEHAYRVETRDRVDMESMVGKQVRVSGVIAKRADLPAVPPAPSGKDEPRTMEKIDKGDLAKIDEASIAVVAGNCGGHADRTSGVAPEAGAGTKTKD